MIKPTWHALIGDQKVVAVSAFRRQVYVGRCEDARLVANACRVARLCSRTEVAMETALALFGLAIESFGDLDHVAGVTLDWDGLTKALVNRPHLQTPSWRGSKGQESFHNIAAYKGNQCKRMQYNANQWNL